MQVMRDAKAVSAYLHSGASPSIANLVQTRLAELLADGYPMEEVVFFVIVEPHDTVSDVERAMGGSMQTPEGHPLWECIQAHEELHEMVFVLASSGYGALVLVPNSIGPNELLDLCRLNAVVEGAPQSP